MKTISGGMYFWLPLPKERKDRRRLGNLRNWSPVSAQYDKILKKVEEYAHTSEVLYPEEDTLVRGHSGYVFGLANKPSGTELFSYHGFQIFLERYPKIPPGICSYFLKLPRRWFQGKIIGAVRDVSHERGRPVLQFYCERESRELFFWLDEIFSSLKNCEIIQAKKLY